MAKLDVVIGAKNEASQVFNEVARDARRLRENTSGGLFSRDMMGAFAAARRTMSFAAAAASWLSVVMKALKGDIEGVDEAAQHLPAGIGAAYKWFKDLAIVVSGASDEIERFRRETEEVDRLRDEMAKRFEANRAALKLVADLESSAVREFGTPRERARLEYEQELKRISEVADRAFVVPGSAVEQALKRSFELAGDAYQRRLAAIAAKEEQERAAAQAKARSERAAATVALRRWRDERDLDAALAAARANDDAVAVFRLEQARRASEMGETLGRLASRAPLRDVLAATAAAGRQLMAEQAEFARKQDAERRAREEKEAEERRATARRVQQIEAEGLREALQAAGFTRAAQLVALRAQLDDALAGAGSAAERDALRKLFAGREARLVADQAGYAGGGVGVTPLTTRYQGYVDMNRPARVEAAVKRADANLERIARAIERGLNVKGIALRN